MGKSSITRLASAAVVSGVATFALAAPASAMMPADPVGMPAPDAVPTDTSGFDWTPLGAGALGGLALAGAGVAAAAGMRRRHHAATPV